MNGYEIIRVAISGIMPDRRPVMLHNFMPAIRKVGRKMRIFIMMVGGGAFLMMAQNQIADMIYYMASHWAPLAGFAYLPFFALKGATNVNKNIPMD